MIAMRIISGMAHSSPISRGVDLLVGIEERRDDVLLDLAVRVADQLLGQGVCARLALVSAVGSGLLAGVDEHRQLVVERLWQVSRARR